MSFSVSLNQGWNTQSICEKEKSLAPNFNTLLVLHEVSTADV